MDTFYNIYIRYFNNNYARILLLIVLIVFIIVFILFTFKIAFYPSEIRDSKKFYKSLVQENLKKLNSEQKKFFIENTKELKDNIKYGLLCNLNGIESQEEILIMIEEVKKKLYKGMFK